MKDLSTQLSKLTNKQHNYETKMVMNQIKIDELKNRIRRVNEYYNSNNPTPEPEIEQPIPVETVEQ